MNLIEKRIGYKFRNSLLLAEALTHPSLAYESAKPHFDNQRLEFLGDAVLQLLLTESLFLRFPDFSEGRLTKLRARIVSKNGLKALAEKIDLGQYVMLGRGEEATGGRERASTLADAFEALIGAVFLDGGIDAARGVTRQLTEPVIEQLAQSPEEKNPKGQLQEILQGITPESPIYQLLDSTGPDHNKTFRVEVAWKGKVLSQGVGQSKKEAEVDAARAAISGKCWEKIDS